MAIQLNKNIVSVAIDAMPYKDILHHICDDSGEQVFGKASLPLVKSNNQNSLEYNAAEVITFDKLYNIIEVKIKDNLYWYNGEKVCADDYLRALIYVNSNNNNRNYSLFSDVAEIKTKSMNILLFKLKYQNIHFLHYLTSLATSQMHSHDKNLTAGHYFISNKTNKAFYLEKNPFFQLDNPTKGFYNVNSLKFELLSPNR